MGDGGMIVISSQYKRVHLIVLDSVGIGEAPDAKDFDDIGADTLGHIAEKIDGLNLPNMGSLGLSNIREIKGVEKVEKPLAFYTKMQEASRGKDTLTGHWEIMGLITIIPPYPIIFLMVPYPLKYVKKTAFESKRF
jgi:phosphopentomutase